MEFDEVIRKRTATRKFSDKLIERNKLETEREVAPLVKAEDAILLDSTDLSIEEVVNEIIRIVNEKRN